ncbi:hypothetical protein ACFYZJ_39050 [Streptomyces sp. NPDC001848]
MPHNVSVEGGCTYLADNASAADVQLSPADLADLADLDALPTPVGARY